MAHNLNFVNGKAAMMYVREKPWHGYGTQLPAAATSAEAIAAAGLDWNVSKKPIYLGQSDGGDRVHGRYAIVRDDTHAILGDVGEQYTALQNKGAFTFFDAIVGLKAAIYQTAGALGRGEKIWCLARLPGEVRVLGDDVAEKYLLLTNRHDGGGAVQIMFTPIRVVCQNTLNIAIEQGTRRTSLRHTSNLGLKVEDVQRELGIINQKFSLFEEASRKLAVVQLTRDAFQTYLKNTGIAPSNDDEISSRSQTIVDQVTQCFESSRGANLRSAKGTAWGAFNAVVEYVDYYRKTRDTIGAGDVDARTTSLLFGSGASLKQTAWDQALALIK
jgi:phage/plasmid-like protein (TIGR03299 family)